MGTQVSNLLLKHLIQEHGPDRSKWNPALRDLVDPSIEARAIAPPLSGKVDKFLNTDYYYYWAFDRVGQNPDNDRVQNMRYAGWEYATTDDVRMCSMESAKGRNKDRKTKDGGDGWSDEIRSGDRRLMKIKMDLWRSKQKADLIAAYQLTIPQTFGPSGPMSTREFIHGIRTEVLDEKQATAAERSMNPSNSVSQKTHKQLEEEKR